MTDSLVGVRKPICVEIRFLVGAGLDLVVEDDTVLILRGQDGLCRLRAPDGFAVETQRGAEQGAVRAPRFGELADAQRIVFSGLMRDSEAATRMTILTAVPSPDTGIVARDLLTSSVLQASIPSDPA